MTQPSVADAKLQMVIESLQCGASVFLELQGTSMLPALWPGDVLTVAPMSGDELATGDLVFVVRAGRSFVHRLVGKMELDGCPSWITRGDSVREEDTPLTTSQVRGRVVSIRRGSRNLIPNRKPSHTDRAFSWMLCHSARITGLVLRIHEFRLNLSRIGLAASLRNFFEPARGVFGFQRSRASHS
jgi:signal peptidase I